MTAPFSPAPLYFGVASSTLITTDRGVMSIGSLADGTWIVWNGVDWEQTTIRSAGVNQPTYTVTLSDGRSLRCSANYNWYVQTPEFVTYEDRWTSQLVVGSSVIWRTLLPTQGDYVMGAFPQISAVAATGVNEDLFYVTTSTGLVLLNGILTSCGKASEGIPDIVTSPTPAPTPTPPATSFPWSPSFVGESPIADSIFFDYTFDATTPTLVTFTSHNNDPNAVIVSYRWEFGDGQVATTQNATYQYRYSPNPYYARLTVRYQNGSYGVTSSTIRFPAAATPAPPTVSFAEPVAPLRNHGIPADPLWLGRLTNGALVAINGVDTTANTNYALDPYYTFEVPAGATNISVNLTDNSTGDFAGGSGWLMVRSGSAASSSDGDQGTVDTTVQSANAQNVFAASVPSNLTVAGEYFASLDANASSLLSGLTIVASWTDPASAAPVNAVIAGDNGNLLAMNSLSSSGTYPSVDFLFDIPGASTSEVQANQPTVLYWEVSVPAGQVLTVTLDDNAAGGLLQQAASSQDVALFITTDAPFSSSYNTVGVSVVDPSGAFTGGSYYDARPGAPSGGMSSGGLANEQTNITAGISVSNVPMYLQYVNETTAAVTVWVSVPNYGSAGYSNVRMLASVTPASKTALDETTVVAGSPSPTPTPTPTGDTWYDVSTILNSMASVNLSTEVDDWVNASSIDYTGGNPPLVYIADASYVWNTLETNGLNVLNQIPSSTHTYSQDFLPPGVTVLPLGTSQVLARMAAPEVQSSISIPTFSGGMSGDSAGDNKVVAAVWGYQPFTYGVNQDLGGVLPAINNTGQLSVLQYPIIIYIREVVILNFTPAAGYTVDDPEIDFTTSKSFVEMAVLFDTLAGANSWLGIRLRDSSYNAFVDLQPVEPIWPWVDVNGNPVGNNQGQSLAVYRFDLASSVMSTMDVAYDWSTYVTAAGDPPIIRPNIPSIQKFTQLFTQTNTQYNTPYYVGVIYAQ